MDLFCLACQAADRVVELLGRGGLRGEDVLVLAPRSDTATLVCHAVEAAVPITSGFGITACSVARFACDVLSAYGPLLGAPSVTPVDDAGRAQLLVEFEASLHLLPTVTFRPPNHPNKFAAALLRHFNLLNV